MASPVIVAFQKSVVGRRCKVTRRENDWSFLFGRNAVDGCALGVQGSWRVVDGGRMALTSEDDRQWFGLSKPVDAEAEAQSILGKRKVVGIEIDPVTSDILVTFSQDARLEVRMSLSGYEGWQACFRHEAEDLMLVGMGGAELQLVSKAAGTSPRVLFGLPLPRG